MKSTTLTASFSLTAPQICAKPDHPESKLRVVFFGTPEFSARFLEGLINDPYFEVVGVVSQPDELVGRKKALTSPPTKLLALQNCISVFQPTKMKDEEFHEALRALKADVFVIVAYGRILPEAILNIPPLGCINVHPSLLPKWRGPSPKQAAIGHGDEETGISIMKIDREMDHGPILAQEKFALEKTETIESLTKKVVHLGVPLLCDTLKAYHAGTITPVEQDHTAATYCKLLSREDGLITFAESAEAIERKVRAYNPWPGTSMTLLRNGEPLPLKVFSVSVPQLITRSLAQREIFIDNGRLFIGTSSTPIEILELQPAGGKRMKTNDFLRGYPNIS
jgi:methionyl-tRNA formyltransferase